MVLNLKEEDKKVIGILVLSIILGSFMFWIIMRGEEGLNQLGKQLCGGLGLEFNYASGETVRCYKLDPKTGIKTRYEYWVDVELAKEIWGGGGE